MLHCAYNNFLNRKITIVHLLNSQAYKTGHKCCATWKGNKSNQSRKKEALVFHKNGKQEYPDESLLEQKREPTNSTHMWHNGSENSQSILKERRFEVGTLESEAVFVWKNQNPDSLLIFF